MAIRNNFHSFLQFVPPMVSFTSLSREHKHMLPYNGNCDHYIVQSDPDGGTLLRGVIMLFSIQNKQSKQKRALRVFRYSQRANDRTAQIKL